MSRTPPAPPVTPPLQRQIRPANTNDELSRSIAATMRSPAVQMIPPASNPPHLRVPGWMTPPPPIQISRDFDASAPDSADPDSPPPPPPPVIGPSSERLPSVVPPGLLDPAALIMQQAARASPSPINHNSESESNEASAARTSVGTKSQFRVPLIGSRTAQQWTREGDLSDTQSTATVSSSTRNSTILSPPANHSSPSNGVPSLPASSPSSNRPSVLSKLSPSPPPLPSTPSPTLPLSQRRSAPAPPPAATAAAASSVGATAVPAVSTFIPDGSFSLSSALHAARAETAAGLMTSLAAQESELLQTRSKMIDISRSNFILERELLEIDEKIKLLIKNRLTIQEVMALGSSSTTFLGGSGGGDGAKTAASEAAAGAQLKQKRLYEELFLLLQSKPRYLALLARLIQPKGDSIPIFVQSVCFDIYGDSFGSYEERLLLSLFKQVLREEMRACTDRATLLRSNSAITQMLSAYAKRGQGLGILRDILEIPLKKLCESREWKNVNLELQPLKIHQNLVIEYETAKGTMAIELDKTVNTDEQAAQIPQVQQVVAARIKQLEEACEMILERILKGVENIPYGMRWICKTIGMLYKERFAQEELQEKAGVTEINGDNGTSSSSRSSSAATPTGLSAAVQALSRQIQSLQGGYIYLRFFNPVIVAPDGMNLIRDKPSRVLRRNLVLIAKVLQNLSNGVLFGGKEAYMQGLNPFIERNRGRMSAFFQTLTSVEDVDESLSIEQYTHSSLGSGSITIQLNQIYAMHALLLQFKEQICVSRPTAPTSASTAVPRVYNPNDPLAELLTNLGQTVPPLVSRSDNVSVTLRLEANARNARVSTVASDSWKAGHAGEGVSELVVIDPFARSPGSMSHDTNPLIQQARSQLLAVLRRIPDAQAQQTDQHPTLLSFLNAQRSASLLAANQPLTGAIDNLLAMLNSLYSMQMLKVPVSPDLDSAAAAALPLAVAKELAFNQFVVLCGADSARLRSAEKLLHRQRNLVDTALSTVSKHRDYLQGRLDVYRMYLQNVRQGQGQGSSGSPSTAAATTVKSSSSGSSDKDIFSKTLKYSHADLLSMQLLASVDADIPAKVLKHLQYSLEMKAATSSTALAPRFFLSVSLKKGINIPLLATPVEIVLEELLTLQERAIPTMQVESVQLNVNILVHLLNTQFIAHIPKQKS